MPTVSLLMLDVNDDTARGVHTNPEVTQQLPKDHLLLHAAQADASTPGDARGFVGPGSSYAFRAGLCWQKFERILHAFLSSYFPSSSFGSSICGKTD